MPFSLDRQPDENEIECANCGALIYDQLTRCPVCGVNLYEPTESRSGGYGSQNRAVHPQRVRLGSWLRDLFHRLTGKPYAAEEIFGESLHQAQLYNDLLQKTGGDREVVERLIAFEQQQKPSGNRFSWLKSAVQRWERDNRTQKPEG